MKHDNAHHLNVACLDCIKVHLRHKEKLLELVRELANEFRGHRHQDDIGCEEWEMISKAKELIKEIKADE